MKIIFVSGPEATGKTFIGKEIASKLGCEYFSKDQFKEHLFNTESHTTWDYSWYENKAKNIFFNLIAEIVSENKSAVLESNFNPEDKKRLMSNLQSSIDIAEVYCTSKGFTSFNRFVKRNENGTRHKGHHDRRWYANVLRQNLAKMLNIDHQHPPLNLCGQPLVVDTTDFSSVDTESIITNLNFYVYQNE